MQIFTEPIFARKTFFLELIHRAGAAGFGVGNITALAKSIAIQQQLISGTDEDGDSEDEPVGRF